MDTFNPMDNQIKGITQLSHRTNCQLHLNIYLLGTLGLELRWGESLVQQRPMTVNGVLAMSLLEPRTSLDIIIDFLVIYRVPWDESDNMLKEFGEEGMIALRTSPGHHDLEKTSGHRFLGKLLGAHFVISELMTSNPSNRQFERPVRLLILAGSYSNNIPTVPAVVARYLGTQFASYQALAMSHHTHRKSLGSLLRHIGPDAITIGWHDAQMHPALRRGSDDLNLKILTSQARPGPKTDLKLWIEMSCHDARKVQDYLLKEQQKVLDEFVWQNPGMDAADLCAAFNATSGPRVVQSLLVPYAGRVYIAQLHQTDLKVWRDQQSDTSSVALSTQTSLGGAPFAYNGALMLRTDGLDQAKHCMPRIVAEQADNGVCLVHSGMLLSPWS